MKKKKNFPGAWANYGLNVPEEKSQINSQFNRICNFSALYFMVFLDHNGYESDPLEKKIDLDPQL